MIIQVSVEKYADFLIICYSNFKNNYKKLEPNFLHQLEI
jgi:hypothetical protein